MSSNTYSTFTSSTSTFSSSTTSGGGTHSYSEQTASNPTGTTIHRTSQQPGKAPVSETTRIPASGGAAARQVEGLDQRGRIMDVSEEEADKRYEENIEEEYAKREGGA